MEKREFKTRKRNHFENEKSQNKNDTKNFETLSEEFQTILVKLQRFLT